MSTGFLTASSLCGVVMLATHSNKHGPPHLVEHVRFDKSGIVHGQTDYPLSTRIFTTLDIFIASCTPKGAIFFSNLEMAEPTTTVLTSYDSIKNIPLYSLVEGMPQGERLQLLCHSSHSHLIRCLERNTPCPCKRPMVQRWSRCYGHSQVCDFAYTRLSLICLQSWLYPLS